MIKMGIMGTGSIAIKMSNTIKEMNSVEMYAIASRDYDKAKEFATEYKYEKAYGSYEEMAADPQLDLVYIATPHSHHYKCAKLALNAGKHVLCEKSFTVNADQARKIIKLAKEKGLLITEAIWTRYMPSRKMIDDIIKSGIIGEIISINANIGYELSDIKRIHDPDLAGGALLDVGVYLLNFARMVMGTDIVNMTSAAIFKNGVDIADNITLEYPNQKMAALHCSVSSVHNRMGAIFGTKGYIEVQNINNPELIKVFNDNYELIETHEVPEQISGYEYEVEACVKAIKNGESECAAMPHQETIAVMEMMDELRRSWNYEILDIE
ncbi:MAG: Gfo/Idh/MocA family oxidoreductase [Saccharofermentanales bacterium]